MTNSATRPLVAAVALSVCALGAHAQASLVRVGTLIATGATLVAGDVTFSNFQAASAPFAGLISDGLGGLAASAAVNADGTVSLTFTMIDPATGLPTLQVAALMQAVSYDVTVTNPTLLLAGVNQVMGPQTAGFNFLNHIEPAPARLMLGGPGIGGNRSAETIFVDEQWNGRWWPLNPPSYGTRTAPLNPAFGYGTPYNSAASALPGGLRTRVSLHSFFGITQDNHGILHPETGPFDSATITLNLVPASTPNPVPAPALAALDFSQPGIGTLGLASRLDVFGLHLSWAPIGGVPVSLTTSNAAALPLPATLTIPEGASTGIFQVGDAQIDAPTVVNVTATLGGTILQQTMTVQPSVPLGLLPLNLQRQQLPFGLGPYLLGVSFNRLNYSTQVVTLTSSNPALFSVPATVTVPPLAQGVGNIAVVQQAAPAVTPVTVTATANGTSVTSTITLPRTIDGVTLNKAELVVKTGSLKVDATGSQPLAVLTLSNAATGQVIGTMTNLGKGKYTFQGTVSPVATLRLDSNYSGSYSLAVAQK